MLFGNPLFLARLMVTACLVTLSACPVRACFWDRDTLAVEAKGMPDYVSAITDRLEHNPPLYYEMRLTRVSGELQKNPSLFADYDDACVACDHLGRGDEAVGWMDRKRGELAKRNPKAGSTKTEWYHYWANIGTARAHRWLRAGANRQEMTEFKKARAEIAKAIKVNPEAHFGREVYQLAFMDWVINPIARNEHGKEYRDPNGEIVVDSMFDRIYHVADDDLSCWETRKAILSLIVQGNASDSVDLMAALADSMATEETEPKTRIGELALLRCKELLSNGGRSLVVGAKVDKILQGYYYHSRNWSNTDFNGSDDFSVVYRRMRTDADQWQSHRMAFMMDRLHAGRHPDTDSTFWVGYASTEPLYSEHNPVGYATLMPEKERADNVARILFDAKIVVLVSLVCWLLVSIVRDVAKYANRRRS